MYSILYFISRVLLYSTIIHYMDKIFWTPDCSTHIWAIPKLLTQCWKHTSALVDGGDIRREG